MIEQLNCTVLSACFPLWLLSVLSVALGAVVKQVSCAAVHLFLSEPRDIAK